MKILYHHRTMGRGAEGAHIAHIVHAFEDAGHEVVVISPPGVDPLRQIGAQPLDKTKQKATGLSALWSVISRYAPQVVFEFLEIGYNFQAIPRLKKCVAEQHIDCIYERAAFFLFAGAFVAKRQGIPLVIEANEAVGIKRARKLFLKFLALRCEQYSIRRARVVCTVSTYLGQMLQKHAGSSTSIQVMPNAVDPGRFKQPHHGEAVRRKLHLEGKTVLGFAGWFDWWDRLDILIEVQKELADLGYSDVVTLLIGHGKMVDDLQEQVIHNEITDKVIFTGPVEKKDVLNYIDALDIGVLPHSNEFGSPMVLFEMMALGKCVVAPDVGPVIDVIDDGINGLIFPGQDKAKLKMRIIELLDDKSKRLKIGKQARERVMQNNTWEKNAERILQALMRSESNQ